MLHGVLEPKISLCYFVQDGVCNKKKKGTVFT